MTSSAPTVTSRQIGERRTSIHDQDRNLTAYQRDANTSEVKTVRQDDVTDIQQSPKPDSRWDQLTEAVTAKGELFLKRLNESDMSELAAWLRTSPSALRSLNMYECGGIDPGAAALADALQINTTLTTLNLQGNGIGADTAVVLVGALKGNTNLTTLILTGNAIGAEGAAALADALKFNTTLRTLDLDDCSLDTGAAEVLADALKANTTLTSLYFSFNDFADSTLWKKISDLLERNRRLELEKYGEASLDLLVRHSPALKNMGFPTDVIPVLANQLSNEVLSVFEQEWQEVLSAPPQPITTTTTNTTVTTTTTTTTDSTIPTTPTT